MTMIMMLIASHIVCM